MKFSFSDLDIQLAYQEVAYIRAQIHMLETSQYVRDLREMHEENNTVINPKTGRRVSRNGRIGKKLLN